MNCTHTAPLMTIRKSQSEEWQIRVREYRGSPYIELRTWFRTADGTWRPSDKGHANIRPDLVGQIVQGLTLAAAAAQSR